MNPAAILKDLISISSVSSESNVEVIRYAEQVLKSAGWECLEQPYLDEQGIAKLNLCASPAGVSQPDLAFVCHTDTVPYDWPAATDPLQRGGNIYGRGACDVKGFLACVLSVIGGISGSIAVILTADEEAGCIGAGKLVESAIVKPRYAVIGEPTSLRPVRAGKGYCLGELKVTGREAHSAFPDLGESAIYKAARVITEVERIAIDVQTDCDPEFDPPYTTLNIGTIHGGRAKNIVPGECSMLLEWRPIPGQAPEHVPSLVSGCDVNILRLQPGFATKPTSPVVSRLVELTGNQPGVVSFGTEAPWIGKMGTEVVVFGPGTMHVAHSREEHVPISELDACAGILRKLSLLDWKPQ
jgi:acetylornithine deacetylase